MQQKTRKYGDWEGFPTILGHFQVILDKKFFLDFLTPGPPKSTLLVHVVAAAGGLAGPHWTINLVLKWRKPHQIVPLCCLVRDGCSWDLSRPMGIQLSHIWECNSHF